MSNASRRASPTSPESSTVFPVGFLEARDRRYLAIDYDENNIKLAAALTGAVLGLEMIF